MRHSKECHLFLQLKKWKLTISKRQDIKHNPKEKEEQKAWNSFKLIHSSLALNSISNNLPQGLKDLLSLERLSFAPSIRRMKFDFLSAKLDGNLTSTKKTKKI